MGRLSSIKGPVNPIRTHAEHRAIRVRARVGLGLGLLTLIDPYISVPVGPIGMGPLCPYTIPWGCLWVYRPYRLGPQSMVPTGQVHHQISRTNFLLLGPMGTGVGSYDPHIGYLSIL